MNIIERIKCIIMGKMSKKTEKKFLPEKTNANLSNQQLVFQRTKMKNEELNQKEKISILLKELKIDEYFIGTLDFIEEIELNNLKGIINFLIKEECTVYEMRIIIKKKPDILIMKLEEIKESIELLKAEGFDKYIKDIIIRNPYMLEKAYKERIKENINFFKEYGFDKWEILNLITSNSVVLIEELSKIKATCSTLEQITTNKENVIKIIDEYPFLVGISDLKIINECIC